MSDVKSKKTVSESRTTHVQVLTQANINGYNRLFGGTLMSWMDIVAAVTARRHSNRNVTTVSVQGLEFKKPAYANDTLVITGEVCFVGKTSMDINVKAYVEELSGEQTLINEAHFIMVALDENENPVPVPGLIIETEEQQKAWDEAYRRKYGK